MKILSIIIPTYNMERYMRKCLDSLILSSEEQMNQLEVLVINDGSKDASSEIAHEYQNKYPQTFRVIDKNNGNYGSCVNRGLKEASGKYIKVLDADDWFDTSALAQLLPQLVSLNCDLVITDYRTVNPDGNTIKQYNYIRRMAPGKVINDFPEFIHQQPFFITMHVVIYRREVFMHLDYHQSEGVSYTDQEWICSPMTRVRTACYINVNVYQYLLGREGQTMDSSVFSRHLPDLMTVVLWMATFYDSMDWEEKFEKYICLLLDGQLKIVYNNILFYGNGNEKDLRAFDEKLKAYPMSYSRPETFDYSRFYNVKLWRQHPYLFHILMKLAKIKHRLCNG